MSTLGSFLNDVGDLDRDLDMILSTEDMNVTPSWAAEAIQTNTVPSQPRSFKATLPQALPSTPLDWSYFSSPRANGNSFRRRATEEQRFYSPFPLCFGEDEAIENGLQADMNWWNSSSEMYSETDRPVGSAGSISKQSSSSDGSQGESCREAGSEDAVDGKWNGVLQLVQNLNHRFTKSRNAGTNNVPKLKMSEEILIALSAIHRNVEKIKAVVPSMAGQGAKFSADLHRQCTAAAGAVKQISQLADAAAAMGVEIERQLDAATSEPGYYCDSMCCEEPPNDPHAGPEVSSDLREDVKLAGSVGNVDRIAPTLPPAALPSVELVVGGCNCSAAQGNNLATTTPLELQGTENECASSLVADLFSPCDRLTGADAFAAPSTATCTPVPSGQWGSDLEEAIRTACVSELKLESFLLDSPSVFSQSRAAEGGGPDAEATLKGDASGPAGQNESDDGGNEAVDQLSSGSFTLLEVDDSELLTEQTHYCKICSKGFKRDANLRMHMRSHGSKYKSLTALVRSEKTPKLAPETVPGGESTRYSCPSVGCSRNIKHPQFQPLKTLLCLKNHYRRSHCAKTLQCSKCKSKQFSVLADLKTHEKHCGCADRWACSCGTTFSRKEKLQGHVRLFVGHVSVDVSTLRS